jgi:hypothetical protein
MFGWLVRLVLFFSGTITGLFFAQGSPRYEITQLAVGLALLVVVMAIAAFWHSKRPPNQ